MKLTLAQKQTLAALLVKFAALAAGTALAEAEQTQLNSLKSLAEAEYKADGKDFVEADFIKEFTASEPGEFTVDQLNEAVSKAVTAALEGKGVKTSDIIDEVKKLVPSPGASIKVEDIEAAVKKHLSSATFDKDALLAEIKKSLPAAGLSRAELDTALDEFAKKQHGPSAHQFPVFTGNFQVEHRSGNLSVAGKQLLNLALIAMPESAFAKSAKLGVKRPGDINEGIDAKLLHNAEVAGQRGIKSIREAIIYGKAITTGGANSGAELVPTDLSSDLQMRLYLESQLASALIASEIDMPSDPFKLPISTTRPVFYVGSENPGADPTASNPGTANVTLDTAKLIGMAEYSYEADEDAIIAILPWLQEQLASGAAFAFEDAVLNGDTTATHQDSDYHAIANHHAKAFKGVRKYCLAGSVKKDLATGGISFANIQAMRKMMGKYGVRPRDLLVVAGSLGYNDIVNLDETLTFDKVGSTEAARVLTGTAGSIGGMPIIVSEAVRENLNASGVYDGSTVTKGSIFLIHRPSWMVGVKRGFTVEIDVDKKRQMNAVIASFRRDFKPLETPATTMPIAVVGYNYTA